MVIGTLSDRARSVQRRCVLYVSGFDPKGASHYHALLRREGEHQARQGGWDFAVGPRRRLADGNSAWSLQARVGEHAVHTDYEFLHWDDIVRLHWTRSTLRLWWQIVATTWLNLRCGALWRMYRLSWPAALALFLPFLLVVYLLLVTPLLAFVLTGTLLHMGAPWSMSACAGLAVAALMWLWGRMLERRYSMYWMMRSYAFNARQAQGKTPELESRLDRHADTLVRKIASGHYDEVLLVGHSSGANMAASILARALVIDPAIARQTTVLSLLTLGQWLPAMALLPMAQSYRAELKTLGAARGVDWIDFSAPPDGCCFALLHPLKGCGIDTGPDGISIKVLNPKFAEMFPPDEYRALKQDKLGLHFQYIRASRRTVTYDYFLTVAGPSTLADRYRVQPSVEDYSGLRGRSWTWPWGASCPHRRSSHCIGHRDGATRTDGGTSA